MHPERGIAAFPQNIYVRNFCNYLRANAPLFKVQLILDLAMVSDKNNQTHFL